MDWLGIVVVRHACTYLDTEDCLKLAMEIVRSRWKSAMEGVRHMHLFKQPMRQHFHQNPPISPQFRGLAGLSPGPKSDPQIPIFLDFAFLSASLYAARLHGLRV